MRRKLAGIIVAASLLFACSAYCDEKTVPNEQSTPVGFYLVCEANNPNCFELATQNKGEKLYLEKMPKLTIDDIASAEYRFSEPPEYVKKMMRATGTDIIGIKFTEEGKSKLSKITSENINKRLGIIIDGKLLSAPVIKEPISGGRLEIMGDTSEEAKSIVQRINELKGNKI